MLKKISSLVILTTLTLIVNAQSISYVLDGAITEDSFNNQKVVLQGLNDERNGFTNIDSTVVKDNKFSFEETILSDKYPIRFVSISQPGKDSMQYLFVPENGKISLIAGESYKISGTPKNEELQLFMDEQDALQKELRLVIDKYANEIQSTPINERRAEELAPLVNRLREGIYNFSKSNIDNYVGEFIATSSFGILSASQILELISMSRPEFKNSQLGREITTYYEAEQMKDGEGSYKDIRLRNFEGKEIALSDYIGKNKVVLIDFWASWCGPCIKEMPTIVKLYKRYKDKGLEIVGISLDDNEQSWIKATQRLNITWPQMSDLQGWKSSAAKLYGITSIPFMMLVGEDGKIIAGNLFGDKLTQKISELLD